MRHSGLSIKRNLAKEYCARALWPPRNRGIQSWVTAVKTLARLAVFGPAVRSSRAAKFVPSF